LTAKEPTNDRSTTIQLQPRILTIEEFIRIGGITMPNEIDTMNFKQPEQSHKPNHKGNGKNSPVIGSNGFLTAPGDNAAILKHAIEIAYRWAPIDLNNDDDVQDRIIEYFQYCFDNDIKPGVEGMALAVGVNRRTLWDWETGDSRNKPGSRRADIIKKSKQILAEYMENLAQNNKINPVTAIFLLKNHFGYTNVDTVEVKATGSLTPTLAPDEIAKQIPKDIPVDVDFSEE
jgi:hypothetical protein